MAFLDVTKAYDKAWLDAIMHVVHKEGLTWLEWEVIRKMNKDPFMQLQQFLYQWWALLKFHAAVLSEVERGRMEWGDDYSRLEQQMLMPFPLGKGKTERRAEKGPGSGKRAVSGSGRDEDRVLYCAEFQNNACHFHNDHGGSSWDSRHCFSTFVRYAGRNQKYGHSIQLCL